MAANPTKPVFTKLNSTATALTPPDATDAREWLGQKEGETRRDDGLEWLLATTFSEVVWGLKKDGQWRLSPAGATLPAGRLVELRAFGPEAEIFVWRDAAGLRARRRRDGVGNETYDTYDEEQLLWGTVRLDGAPDGFTRLAEGEQGLGHEPPLELDGSYFVTDENDKAFGHRPARLWLRHYIGRHTDIDSSGRDVGTGLARIVDSRLLAVLPVKPKPETAEEAKQDESPA